MYTPFSQVLDKVLQQMATQGSRGTGKTIQGITILVLQKGTAHRPIHNWQPQSAESDVFRKFQLIISTFLSGENFLYPSLIAPSSSDNLQFKKIGEIDMAEPKDFALLRIHQTFNLLKFLKYSS